MVYDVVLAWAAFTQNVAPTISGTGAEGQTLTVSPGGWRPSPQRVQILWYRNSRPIPGANGTSTPSPKSDAGTAISASVAVSGPWLDELAVRTPAIQIPGTPILQLLMEPRLKGTARVGHVLELFNGKIKPTPTILRYRWFRGGKRIRGVRGLTYRVGPADRGRRIKVVLKARRDGYGDLTATAKSLRVPS